MEKPENKDDFLAKWASGTLTEEEMENFKKSGDYPMYQAILEGTELLEVPQFDKEGAFRSVKEQQAKKGKIISFIPKWAYAVAASVVLFFGYLWMIDDTIIHATQFGEQLVIQLPDNSSVILNSRTKLAYREKDWEKGLRKLDLDGEAYFEVEKGSDFSVVTPNGKVTVLGTQFTVNSNVDFFEVICYDGKVKVTTLDLEEMVARGEAIRVLDGSLERFNLEDNTPSWIQEESSFMNTPLHVVVRALENHYNINVEPGKVDLEQRFTGSFTHTNLDVALRSVFESMQIKVTFKDRNTIVLDQK
ncbi:MAG: FecR domain-containing protein [Bacteroidota bacterium]